LRAPIRVQDHKLAVEDGAVALELERRESRQIHHGAETILRHLTHHGGS